MRVRIQVLSDDGKLLQEHVVPAFAVTNQLAAGLLDGGFRDDEVEGRRFLGYVFAAAIATSDGEVLTPRVGYDERRPDGRPS